MEDAIARTILGEEPSTQTTLANLQGVDLMVQTLGELGAYLDAISSRLSPDPRVDVSAPIDQLSLRDLARKLSGGANQAVIDQRGDISGEVDLF